MSEPPPTEESLLQHLQALVRELPLMLSDRVELLALELQRAGLALARIVAMVVAAAVMCVTAWMLLWVGIVVALMQVGLAWPLALLLALLVNALMAWAAVSYARRQSALLTLPATRRHLTVRRTPEPSHEPGHAAAAPVQEDHEREHEPPAQPAR